MSAPLVLSLFPGLGLLDMAFEEAGFCVVRGPDLLWGGDVCRFHPPVGRFDGVIGGPPCQSWSGLGAVNKARWGADSIMPCRIPEYERCVNEAQPTWYVMENVPAAPTPSTPGYHVVSRIWNNRWSGGEQNRQRRFSFGSLMPTSFQIEGEALDTLDYVPAVISTGQAGKGGPRASLEAMAAAQGIDPARFADSPFTTTELRRAIANGVPLPMGRAVAAAVCRAIGFERNAG